MRIIPPSKNLGCLGFRISESLYFDFYRSPHWGAFLFLKGVGKLWIHLNGFKFDGVSTDIVFRLKVSKLAVNRRHWLVH